MFSETIFADGKMTIEYFLTQKIKFVKFSNGRPSAKIFREGWIFFSFSVLITSDIRIIIEEYQLDNEINLLLE